MKSNNSTLEPESERYLNLKLKSSQFMVSSCDFSNVQKQVGQAPGAALVKGTPPCTKKPFGICNLAASAAICYIV